MTLLQVLFLLLLYLPLVGYFLNLLLRQTIIVEVYSIDFQIENSLSIPEIGLD